MPFPFVSDTAPPPSEIDPPDTVMATPPPVIGATEKLALSVWPSTVN